MFVGGGLVCECVDLALDKMDGAFVFVLQGLIWVSFVKGLVEKKAIQVQNETELILEHVHV